MSSQEAVDHNPYHFPEVIRYDEGFAEVVEGIPQEHVDAAFTNSLMANRVLVEASLGKVLEQFVTKHDLARYPHIIEPHFGFIRGSDTRLYSLNTLDLHWFDRQKEKSPVNQASVAIIDGNKMGGYVGGKPGRIPKLNEVFDFVARSTVILPVVPQVSVAIPDEVARGIRREASDILERIYGTISGIADLDTQVKAVSEGIVFYNPQEVA